MREILYHGKRLDNGEWVEGYYLRHGDKAYICPEVYAFYRFDGGLCLGGFIEVDPDTVGRETGLTDRNGKRIFEGDILQASADGSDDTAIAEVHYGRYHDADALFDAPDAIGWYITVPSIPGECATILSCMIDGLDIEVIGNIHDTPELLERGRE